ncbi:MAG: class I SAM-dependent methyltransferase [Acidobacteriia bacterium]|nr:class I SAM-dependent methyltransferase [Terriglobia bacterium]
MRAGVRVMKLRFALLSVSVSSLAGKQRSNMQPILDDICLPPFMATSDCDDFEALMRIVAVRRPKLVLELGTAHGNTVANICRACPEARVVTVNALPEQLSGKSTTYDLSKDEIGRVYRQYGFADRVVQVWANTMQLDLSPYLPHSTVDLAIVDACHDCEYVINDFHKVIPYVRPGGMVLLHDTHPSLSAHLWSSYKACMTLRRLGFNICHIQDTWWGVWIKQADEGGRAAT